MRRSARKSPKQTKKTTSKLASKTAVKSKLKSSESEGLKSQTSIQKHTLTTLSADFNKDNVQIILEIKRHWFGLASIYAITIVVLLFFFLFLPLGGFVETYNLGAAFFTLGFMAVVILAILFVLIYKVYTSNKLMITKLDIRLLTRKALFVTQSSILGLANIEDVTVHQKGFFAHLFDYGVFNIETAGEQANFEFLYCPQPKKCVRILMETRESYLQGMDLTQQVQR